MALETKKNVEDSKFIFYAFCLFPLSSTFKGMPMQGCNLAKHFNIILTVIIFVINKRMILKLQ